MSRQRTIRQLVQAAYKAASSNGNVHETEVRLNAIQEIYKSIPDFRHLLFTKRVSDADKKSILTAVLTEVVTEFELELLSIMIDGDVIQQLPEVIAGFQRLADTDPEFVKVTVTTTEILTEQDMAHITTHLEQTLKKSVYPQAAVDKKMLGGLKLRIGNTIVDGSIARRIEKLRDSLIRT